MHHRLRALLALALSAVLLALGAASAAAITIGPGGAGTLTGSITFGGPRIAFRCGVALDTTIAAGTYGAGAAIGTVDRAAGTGCTLLVPEGTPITVEALDASGALPYSIPAGVLATIAGFNCLWRGTLRLTTATGATGTVDTTQVFTPVSGPLTAAFCASSLGNVSTVAGSLTHTPNWTIALP